MKKLFLLLIFASAVSVSNAQSGFSLGPKIGYNANTLSTDMDSIKSGINNSFQIGVFARLGKKVYFQPELNYQLVKQNLTKVTPSSVIEQDFKAKTVKIPLLVGYKLINSDRLNLRLMAGPAIAFVFDKKLSSASLNELWPVQSADDIKNSIWTMQTGAGVDFLFATLDVRYEFGISNWYTGNSDFKSKQNIFNVSLGIKLL